MNTTKKPIFHYANIVALLILAFIGGIFAGQTSFIQQFIQGPGSLPNVSNSGLYTNVWNLIHQDYFVKNVNDQNLFYSSIKGMVASLNDPATLYLPPSEASQFNNATSGNTFAGIGVELSYKDNNVIVQRILPNGPASSSSLKAGDQLLSVDGKDTTGQDISTIADEIRGGQGTSVSLNVKHLNDSASSAVSIKREPIHVDSMYIQTQTDTKGNKVDDLVVSRFTEDTLSDWETKWDQSVQQIKNDNVNELVIDLRGNPGGYFDAAVYGLSDFLPKNSVAAMQEGRDGSKTRFYTQTDPKLGNVKVVILVNDNTASAAEIFSGAMQYYKKATIVGINTYGKGTAQKVYDFKDGSELHLTTDHWLLPSGRWIQKSDPIHPDISIDYSNDDFLKGNDPQMAKGLSLF